MRRIPEATRNRQKAAKAARAAKSNSAKPAPASQNVASTLPLWQLDIGELAGHNLESRGRDNPLFHFASLHEVTRITDGDLPSWDATART